MNWLRPPKRRPFLKAAERFGLTVEMTLKGTEWVAVKEYRELGEMMRQRGIVDAVAEIERGLARTLIESRGTGTLRAADVMRLVDEARQKIEELSSVAVDKCRPENATDRQADAVGG